MDLSKAFDIYKSFPPYRKIRCAWPFYQIHELCSKYRIMLNYRMQRMNVDNKFSSWEDIYNGLPQRSMLHPLFSNNLVNGIHILDFLWYATTLNMLITTISTKSKNIWEENMIFQKNGSKIMFFFLVNVNSLALKKFK